MPLKLYNTLTRKKEIFKPIEDGKVKIYVCGPTIYDYAHIGNWRAYISADILRRTLEFIGYKIKEVMNLTDVDDKTIQNSQKAGKKLRDFTKIYEKAFLEDIKKMNLEKPEVMPKATEHIKEMVSIVKDLMKKGFAYKTEDGIYFSIKKFKDYGKLSGIKIKKLEAGASKRISQDEYDKENVNDFVLWKFYDNMDGDVFWETEIGKGRPGWHIECSAMSMKYLGKSFDIHMGGADLIFPHHENEIAQSEASTGKNFAKYWIHNGWLLVDGKKMSKSLRNFYKLNDILEKGYSTIDLRYLYLSKNYRQHLNFTFKNLESAKNSLERLKNILSELKKSKKKANKKNIEIAKKQFIEFLNDDLNTPRAMSYLWEILRDNRLNETEKYTLSIEFDKVFGLNLVRNEEAIINEIKKLSKKDIDLLFYNCGWIDKEKGKNKSLPSFRIEEIRKGKGMELIKTFIQETGIQNIEEELNNLKIPKGVSELVKIREEARIKKDFTTADKYRDKIRKKGFIIEDSDGESRVRKL